jgi:hypothetical protein
MKWEFFLSTQPARPGTQSVFSRVQKPSLTWGQEKEAISISEGTGIVNFGFAETQVELAHSPKHHISGRLEN